MKLDRQAFRCGVHDVLTMRPLRQWAARLEGLSVVLAAMGVAVIVAGRIFHVVHHPEWTEAQALLNLWHVWALGVLCGIGAFTVAMAGRR